MSIEFNHLLVPIDFEGPSELALETAIELADRFGAQLTLVHVFEVPAYLYAGTAYVTTDLLAPIEAAAREQLSKKLHAVQGRMARAQAILRRGSPAQGILAVLEELRPDLVVVGTHGRTGVGHALLGSVAEKIVRLSPVPVLTLRAAKA